MHRIAGYAALLEPGAVDPVQARIVAAARAVASGQVLVCDSATGALSLVDPDYELESLDGDDAPAGAADDMPPDVALGEPPAHAALPDEQVLVDELGGFDEWVAEFWSEREPGVLRHPTDVEAGPTTASRACPLPGAAELANEPGVRVPRRLPAGMGSLPGGAELAGVLESVQLGQVGAYELVEVVAACQRMASAMEALQASAVSELSHRVEMRPAEGVRSESMSPGRVTELEVGARLMTSKDHAGQVVSRAALICERLPDTYAMWRSGVLPTEKVDVLVAKLAGVDAELARQIEARVLPGAVSRTTESLRRQIGRLLHKLAPKSAKKRHEESNAERFVRITPAPDGMAWLEAYLSAEDAAAVKATLDAGAATLKRHDDAHDARASGNDAASAGHAAGSPASGSETPGAGSADGAGPAGGAGGAGSTGRAGGTEPPVGGDEGVAYRRTAGNRRADVLAALAWAALSTGRIGGCGCGASERDSGSSVAGGGFGLSSARGRPVTVNVTVPLSSLLGDSDEPGELDGYGPITAETARRLAADGTWRRIVTDPLSGAVLDVGRTRYTPPRELADHVLARDQRCRWPNCDRPASGVGIQLDHTIAFHDGGTTANTNLGVFCDPNHIDKHQAGWTVVQPEPGRFVFTSPTGHTYTTDLEPVGPTPDEMPEDMPPPPGVPDKSSTAPPPF